MRRPVGAHSVRSRFKAPFSSTTKICEITGCEGYQTRVAGMCTDPECEGDQTVHRRCNGCWKGMLRENNAQRRDSWRLMEKSMIPGHAEVRRIKPRRQNVEVGHHQ